MKILIIDDEKMLCDAMADFIELTGKHKIIKLYDSRNAIDIIKKEKVDLVITDVRMPYITGIEIARQIKDNKIAAEILLISGEADIIESINALDLGIFDFFIKPVDVQKIAILIQKIEKKIENPARAFELKSLLSKKQIQLKELRFPEEMVIPSKGIGNIVIASDYMKKMLKKLKKIALFHEIPVLIEGKTGTGKEIIAQLIHTLGQETETPFVGINCAAIDKNLFESELFGYEKGAFTGADPKGKKGKIEIARGGTLFLDEVTEISVDLQTKLLRVLQEKEYYKVGGNRMHKVNTRIICATNRNIRKLIKEGLFREDLFYRLDVCKVTLPSLNRRKDEIVPLALLFMKDIASEKKINISKIDGEVLDFLQNYNWTGNIRQLKNTITKALIFSETPCLTLDDFSFLIKKTRSKTQNIDPVNFTLPEAPFALDMYMENIIEKALIRFEGNKSKTAAYLGLDRFQLYNRYRHVVTRYKNRNKQE